MIHNDQELEATIERIRYFQQQVEKLRQVETNPQNYRFGRERSMMKIDIWGPISREERFVCRVYGW